MPRRKIGVAKEDGSLILKALLPFLTACVAAVLLTACEDREDRVDRLQVDAGSIEELSVEAQRSANDGRYIEAARLLDQIDRQFPTSPEAPRALVLAGRYYFEAREYERATGILSRFIRDHGGHPDIAYAYYLRGVSSYRSVSDVDKDEGDTRNAAKHLEVIIDKFSGTDYALDASVKLNAIKNQRAAKELVTGKFYHHRREYMAALNRYQNVLQDFSDSTYIEEALYRIIEGKGRPAPVYRKLLSARTPERRPDILHQFPSAQHDTVAQTLCSPAMPADDQPGTRHQISPSH